MDAPALGTNLQDRFLMFRTGGSGPISIVDTPGDRSLQSDALNPWQEGSRREQRENPDAAVRETLNLLCQLGPHRGPQRVGCSYRRRPIRHPAQPWLKHPAAADDRCSTSRTSDQLGETARFGFSRCAEW
jgi:hypothetical protein